VRVWSAENGDLDLLLYAHTGAVRFAAFADDDQKVVSAGADGLLKVWRVSDGHLLFFAPFHVASLRPVSTGAGDLLVFKSVANLLLVLDPAALQVKAALPTSSHATRAAAFSHDGRVLVAGNVLGELRLWEVATAQPIAIIKAHAGAVEAVAFTPDGARLASAGADRLARTYPADARGMLAVACEIAAGTMGSEQGLPYCQSLAAP